MMDNVVWKACSFFNSGYVTDSNTKPNNMYVKTM